MDIGQWFVNTNERNKHFITMILILDVNSEHVAHAWRKLGLSGEKKTIFDCASISELPSNTAIYILQVNMSLFYLNFEFEFVVPY